MNQSRRDFLQRWTGWTAVAAMPVGVHAALLTPRQSAGPFYPPQLPLDHDNDLVHVAGQDSVAKGSITDLTGRLLDSNGRPLSGVRIEIWQCDSNGRYRHPRDPGEQPLDPGFQGFGHTVTNSSGRYRFLTLKPTPYPGRTPHIHVAVYPDDSPPFVTQLYVAGEPRNANDFLYRQIAVEQRALVTAEFFSRHCCYAGSGASGPLGHYLGGLAIQFARRQWLHSDSRTAPDTSVAGGCSRFNCAVNRS